MNDTAAMTDLLKDCFDDQGHFSRKVFERNIPEFCRCEKQVFEVLWRYLKEIVHRQDRVAFLNSLQLLIARMQQSKRALRLLIDDFCADPERVQYSDRNAMMLAILLVRRYNKELKIDIEQTPEEVLLVKEGLDRDVTNYAVWRIQGSLDNFSRKIAYLHQLMLQALDSQLTGPPSMPFGYLLALDREICIFLALVGGKEAGAVLRSAVKIYGDPESDIFVKKQSRDHLTTLLQHLNVLIRSLGRVGSLEDLPLLTATESRRQKFLRMAQSPRDDALVDRAMQWIGMARKNIRMAEA